MLWKQILKEKEQVELGWNSHTQNLYLTQKGPSRQLQTSVFYFAAFTFLYSTRTYCVVKPSQMITYYASLMPA